VEIALEASKKGSRKRVLARRFTLSQNGYGAYMDGHIDAFYQNFLNKWHMDYSGDPGSQDLEILELIELRTLGHLRYFGGLARQVEIALKTRSRILEIWGYLGTPALIFWWFGQAGRWK
jgi:hypothetical protein